MEIVKNYKQEEGEDTLGFVRRVIAEQTNQEPLRTVVQLVEIVVSELKGTPCNITATTSDKVMKVTICHSGKPIDKRMLDVMRDHTDYIDYYHDGDFDWRIVITREIPPAIANKPRNGRGIKR